MVQDIAPEDTQICGGRIGDASKFPSDLYGPPIVADKFQNGCDQHKLARSPNPAQDEARRRTPDRYVQTGHQHRAQDGTICAAIDQKVLGYWTATSPYSGTHNGSQHPVVAQLPFTSYQHRYVALSPDECTAP